MDPAVLTQEAGLFRSCPDVSPRGDKEEDAAQISYCSLLIPALEHRSF